MATVELSFTPLPAHVRTARLVATAVARRSRVDESLLDEVRLAVGEACSRAVEAHRLHCPTEPVRIKLSDSDGRFEVAVTDTVPSGTKDGARLPARGPAGEGGGSADAVETPGQAGTVPAGEALRAAGGETAGGDAPGGGPAGDDTGTATPAPEAAVRHGAVTGNPVPQEALPQEAVPTGSLPADIGLAVIEGLADDVRISATPCGVTIRMSWPLLPRPARG